MPQVELVSKGLKRPVIWGSVAVVGVVLIVVGVLVLSGPKTPRQDTKTVITQAADKIFTGDRATAIGMLNDQLKQAKSDEDRVILYMSLGSAYESKPDNNTALEMYLKADGIHPAYGINEAVARVAELAGDKSRALDYYGRNRKLIKDGKAPQHAEELEGLEQKMIGLGGKL